VKLEGDAVFCYGDDVAIKQGETLVEIIDWRPFESFTSRATMRLRGGLLGTAHVFETRRS